MEKLVRSIIEVHKQASEKLIYFSNHKVKLLNPKVQQQVTALTSVVTLLGALVSENLDSLNGLDLTNEELTYLNKMNIANNEIKELMEC